MESRPLRLVAPGPVSPPRRPAAVATLSLALLCIAGAASLLGAHRGREPFDAGQIALRAVEPLLGGEVHEAASLRTLRMRLAHRPLDAVARILYAGALEAVARDPAERAAAAFHARAAATLAPRTLPVVRGAAIVLARCGNEEEALALSRRAFEHDPAAAARLLADLEPYVPEAAPAAGLADTPEAWVAWGRRLLELGRTQEGEERLANAVGRWPGHLPAREALAEIVLIRGGLSVLARWVPSDLPLPPEPAAAGLLCYRAQVRAARGDIPGAHADIEEALGLRGGDPSVLSMAADASVAVGDFQEARARYRRALYQVGGGPSWFRAHVLVRLAQLEDRHGSAADALRAWREVVREFPDADGARRRVHELEGPSR